MPENTLNIWIWIWLGYDDWYDMNIDIEYLNEYLDE